MINRDGWLKDPKQLSLVVKGLEREHGERLSDDKGNLRAYYNRPVALSMRDPSHPTSQLVAYEAAARGGFNKTSEVIDAGLAQVCESLKANIVPRAANNHKLRIQCQKLGAAVDGVFDAVDFYDLAADVALDGSITTIGALHWYLDAGSEIRCERLNPLCVYWHQDEGRDPLHVYISMPFARSVALSRWPDAKAAINKARTWSPPTIIGVDSISSFGSDTIRVDIGYRRADGVATGKVLMCVDDGVLENHPWPHRFIPVVPFRWKSDHEGWGGVPLARAVVPYHHAINRQQRMIEESLTGAAPQLLVHEDDASSTLSDMPFARIVYTGARKPELWTPSPVSPQAWEQVDRLSAGCYAETGVNAMQAQGNTRVGVNSAPAQRESVAVASARVAHQKRQWRNLHVASARCVVGLGAVAYKDKEQVVMAPGTDELKSINWSDIDLREDAYRIRFLESSGLSATFAGLVEEVGHLESRGAMSAGAATRALAHRMPDIAQAASRATAGEDLANSIVDAAKSEGRMVMPPSLDAECIKAVLTIGTQEWLRGQSDGTPPENLEMLRRVLNVAKAKTAGPMPPPAPAVDMTAPPMPMAGPPDMTMPPPDAMPPLPPDALPPMPEAPL